MMAIISQPLWGNAKKQNFELRQYADIQNAELHATSPVLTNIRRLRVEKPPTTPFSVIKEVFGSASGEAVAIAKCESGLNPLKVNYEDAKITGYPSWGLFMINGREFAGWEDPYLNTLKAKELYNKYGWIKWLNCYNKMLAKN